jgi:hypothetical protein
MPHYVPVKIALVLTLVAAAAVPLAAQAPKSRAEWAALRDAKFSVPEGQTAIQLLREMNGLLGSPDPFLRDNVAYEAAARWIYTDGALSAAEQREMLALWTANLKDGLGETSGDRAFRRSFSALDLSILAARNNAQPFLSQQEFDGFFDTMVGYFTAERDTRGYDEAKGWIHAAAHTADALKFLARSPNLAPAGQARLLEAIEVKARDFGGVFQWGEDERIAQVIVSLARRADFDLASFEAWLAAIPPRKAALWANAPAIDPAKYPEVQNLTLVLRAAHTTLALDAARVPAGDPARAAILAALGKLR